MVLSRMISTLLSATVTMPVALADTPVVEEIPEDSLEQVFPGGVANSRLIPFNQSGINANISLVDNGISLTVTGRGSGFIPGRVYASLVYDTGSVATGPRACLSTNRTIPFNAMILGIWVVDALGNGVLASVKTGPLYVPLRQIGTASVREDTNVGQPLPPNPDPVRFQLRACGPVIRR